MENAIYEIAMNELKDNEVRTLNQDILNDDKYKHLITKENSTDTNNLFSGLNKFTVRKTQNKDGEDIISYDASSRGAKGYLSLANELIKKNKLLKHG